jgi:hypothetical protein
MRRTLAEALADFAAKNSETWHFDVRGFKNTRLDQATKERGPFKSEISFSAIGFDRHRTVAVVYATFWCGPRCARATYHILNKHDGKWTDVREMGRCGWIS